MRRLRLAPHLKPICLLIHVTDVDSSFVTEEEFFALSVGVNAYIVLVTLFMRNERFHDEGVEDACHNFHLPADVTAEGRGVFVSFR